MKQSVREPKQERSIEKKNKIINAGYELFAEVGYYETNTAEIAKRAGVSTGIVYGYFKDKKDILMYVLDIYINSVFDRIMNVFNNLSTPISFEILIPNVINEVLEIHKQYSKIHEALHSMSSSDIDVGKAFIKLEDDLTKKIGTVFDNLGLNIPNKLERIHYAMDIIQSFCHEYIFDNHDYIDYSAFRDLVTNSIIKLFIC